MNIFEEIEKKLQNSSTVNIVIAGITCSGKTTLTSDIKKHFESIHTVTILAQDDYFKNIEDIPRSYAGALTDSIDAFHTEEFLQDVNNLLTNGITTTPTYDISSNSRVCKSKIICGGNINIFEGLHTIELLSNLDNCIKIYVDTDSSICLKRRIERDFNKYGVPKMRIREYWAQCITPMCDKYIFPQKQLADIILKKE